MQPLALICSENLVLGNQLVNRLQDLGYRAQVSSDASALKNEVLALKPLVVIADLRARSGDVFQSLRELRADAAISHTPVLGVTSDANPKFQASAVEAGATLVAMENGILAQLPQLLDHALAVE